MAWNDRLKEAAYISPLGFRRTFIYEDVSKEFDKKTTAFQFPAKDGTYVQDLGKTGYRYPMRIFFWGDDYDREALAFEAELREKGIGRLEHPIYGTKNVIPFGTITRRDDLKTVANQAIIEVTLWETIFEIYAGAITDIADLIFEALNLYNDAASGQLNTEIVLDKVFETSAFRNFYSRITTTVISNFSGIVSGDPKVSTQFSQVGKSMTADLAGEEDPNIPVLANQTTILTQLPARATDIDINTRMDAYQDLLTPTIDPSNIVPPGYDNRADNEFHSRDIFAASYITGMIISSVNTVFTTKPQVLNIAEQIITAFESWVEWREDNYDVLDKNDTGEMYGALQEAVALAVGYLVQISFSLETEKIIILTRSRNLLELVAELYGEVDDRLDFFINSNNLTGSEILEIPKGRQIVYYI